MTLARASRRPSKNGIIEKGIVWGQVPSPASLSARSFRVEKGAGVALDGGGSGEADGTPQPDALQQRTRPVISPSYKALSQIESRLCA